MISLSMNSRACGSMLAILTFGTVEIAVSRSSKGTIRDRVMTGAGMSFSVSSVMMPSVPSEPIIRFSRL